MQFLIIDKRVEELGQLHVALYALLGIKTKSGSVENEDVMS